MNEAVAEDSASRPWPGAKNVSPIPWPEEQAVADNLNLEGHPAGRYVLAAACIDYAYLGDVAEASRLAWGVGAAAVPRTERELSARRYRAVYETPANSQRIDHATCKAAELGRAVPADERADTIRAGEQFIDQTAGHIAVRHFVEILRLQGRPTA